MFKEVKEQVMEGRKGRTHSLREGQGRRRLCPLHPDKAQSWGSALPLHKAKKQGKMRQVGDGRAACCSSTSVGPTEADPSCPHPASFPGRCHGEPRCPRVVQGPPECHRTGPPCFAVLPTGFSEQHFLRCLPGAAGFPSPLKTSLCY